MATVRKRRWEYPKGSGDWKGAWVLTYTDQAGKRRSGGQFERKKDAEVQKRRIEDEIGHGIHTPSRDTVTFEYASEQFMRDAEQRWKAKDLAGNTFIGYGNQVKHVQSFWNAVKLTEITSPAVKQWVDNLAAQKTTKCVTRRLIMLNMVLNFAVAQDPPWLIRNPLVDRPVTVRGKGQRPESVMMPAEHEMQIILQQLSKRKKTDHHHTHRNMVLIVTLAALTGMRIGEICGLQWEDIDWDANEINVRNSLSRYDGLKQPKTAAGDRKVPMVPAVRAALDQHAANFGGELTGFVLRSQPGWFQRTKPNGTVVRRPSRSEHPRELKWGLAGLKCVPANKITGYFWPKLLRDAGIVDENGRHKYNLHALRHFFVSLLIKEGHEPFYISKVIGHSNVATTLNIYGHLFPSDSKTRLAMERVAIQFATPALPSAAKPVLLREALEPERARMRRLHAEGMSYRQIAKEMGVRPQSVAYWVNPECRERAKARERERRGSSSDAARVQHEGAKKLIA